MTQLNDSGEPRDGHSAGRGSRFSKVAIATALAVFGGALLAQVSQSPSSLALASDSAPGAAPASAPAAGTTWITGTVTDQAAHGQDNVNVEAWAAGGTAPAASALTYGGANYAAVSAHGFFRLEVPSDQAYTIVFSAVGAKEDGDPFRMKQYGSGRPIMVRPASVTANASVKGTASVTATASVAAAGRIRDLGAIPLARQGKVTSTIKAVVPKKGKVQVGARGQLQVAVTSKYVTDVKGDVVVKVDGKKLKGKLTAADHGKLTMKLPKFSKAGQQKVVAQFVGTNTVKSAKAKPVNVKVVGK